MMTLHEWGSVGSLALYFFFALVLITGLIAKHFDL